MILDTKLSSFPLRLVLLIIKRKVGIGQQSKECAHGNVTIVRMPSPIRFTSKNPPKRMAIIRKEGMQGVTKVL